MKASDLNLMVKAMEGNQDNERLKIKSSYEITLMLNRVASGLKAIGYDDIASTLKGIRSEIQEIQKNEPSEIEKYTTLVH